MIMQNMVLVGKSQKIFDRNYENTINLISHYLEYSIVLLLIKYGTYQHIVHPKMS